MIDIGPTLLALFIGFTIGVVSKSVTNSYGHEQLGSVGHVCFANKTCRIGLTCLVKEGLNPDGVCVKP